MLFKYSSFLRKLEFCFEDAAVCTGGGKVLTSCIHHRLAFSQDRIYAFCPQIPNFKTMMFTEIRVILHAACKFERRGALQSAGAHFLLNWMLDRKIFAANTQRWLCYCPCGFWQCNCKLNRLLIERMGAERNRIYIMFFWDVLTHLHLCANIFLSMCFYFLSLAKNIKLEVESFINLRNIYVSCL